MHLQLHTTSMSQLLRRLLLPCGTNSNSTPPPPPAPPPPLPAPAPGPLAPACWLLLLSRSWDGPTESPGVAVAAGVLALLRGTWVGAVLGVGHAHSHEPPDRDVSDRKRMMSFTCSLNG